MGLPFQFDIAEFPRSERFDAVAQSKRLLLAPGGLRSAPAFQLTHRRRTEVFIEVPDGQKAKDFSVLADKLTEELAGLGCGSCPLLQIGSRQQNLNECYPEALVLSPNDAAVFIDAL